MLSPDYPATQARFSVLASGSSGNCSAIEFRRRDGSRRLALVDLGLSPRRTQRLLHERGVSLSEVTDAFVTHFDRDHFHSGWGSREHLPFKIHVHERHEVWARQCGLAPARMTLFDGPFMAMSGVRTSTSEEFHDERGVIAYRFDLASGASIGIATDLGSVTSDLIDLLHRVSLLAIESNYCPKLQEASARPAFLKRRIMGGAGHLSNQQAANASELIEPRDHVVLMHLSRDCNTPQLAQETHEGRPYALTVPAHGEGTAWIDAPVEQPQVRHPAAELHV